MGKSAELIAECQYRSAGRFPDMAIKLSRCESDFTGGGGIENLFRVKGSI